MLSMDKSTISTGQFSIAMFVYQRVLYVSLHGKLMETPPRKLWSC
jgi:hypothetical protein